MLQPEEAADAGLLKTDRLQKRKFVATLRDVAQQNQTQPSRTEQHAQAA